MKPAAVLIGPFQIHIARRTQIFSLFQNSRVAHAGVKPYIENIDLLGKFSILAVWAGCVFGHQVFWFFFKPDIRAAFFHQFHQMIQNFLSQHFIFALCAIKNSNRHTP